MTKDTRPPSPEIGLTVDRRVERRDRQVLAVGEMPDQILNAVSAAEMSPRHWRLDQLAEDWKP